MAPNLVLEEEEIWPEYYELRHSKNGKAYSFTAVERLYRKHGIIAGPCSKVKTENGGELVALDGSDEWFAVNDFSIEPLENVVAAVAAVADALSKGGNVRVCCKGGCGRTGTVVALYLVLFKGYTAEEAIEEFERERGCGPETEEQKILIRVAEELRKRFGAGEALKLLAASGGLSVKLPKGSIVTVEVRPRKVGRLLRLVMLWRKTPPVVHPENADIAVEWELRHGASKKEIMEKLKENLLIWAMIPLEVKDMLASPKKP